MIVLLHEQAASVMSLFTSAHNAEECKTKREEYIAYHLHGNNVI